jgi:1-deoxyxylulose-5-phosphate synthase
MDYVRLGKSGLKVSRLSLGCMSYGPDPGADRHSGWALSEEDSRPFIKAALDIGINFFDTSNIYGQGQSEEILGRAIKDFANRDEVVIATKVFAPLQPHANALGLSRKAIFSAIDASLKRLQTDYIDLYQAHAWDPTTPIEETMEAFHDLIKAGKVRYIGACNFYAWQLAKVLYTADLHGWTRFVSIQSQYNLVYREDEREIHAFARDQGLGILPWSPMARGFLAGNRRRDGTAHTARAMSDPWGEQLYGQPHDFDVAERLSEIATARGEKPIKVALAWVASKPGITAPIIGATKPGHLEDAASALTIELTKEEIERLEEPYRARAPWALTA